MTLQEAIEHWRRTGFAPPAGNIKITAEMMRALRDTVTQSTGYGTTGQYGFEYICPEDIYARPPLHGATDYRRRPDGVWEMPK